jgi:sterol desaturase/sphingolipid hydroxylase (fatty acid hydroxylase superfamily)
MMNLFGSLGEAVLKDLFRLGTNNAVPGYFVALSIVVGFTFARAKKHRSISLAVLRRAILPKRIWASRSGRADIAFALFGLVLSGAAYGWAIVGEPTVRSSVSGALTNQLGPIGPWISRGPAIVLTTLCLYLAYELGYWLDHYLKHRVDLLWRFHAVHHSAESLSPLTNFRMHPVDSIIFANILVLVTGAAAGLLDHFLGRTAQTFAIDGMNALMLTGFMLLSTLQHSHFWISFHGRLGRIFLSPAHHQLHHSTDPAHFNSNLGSTLAIWDFLFGTLCVPTRSRQSVRFGVEGITEPHSFRSMIIMPFIEVAAICSRGVRTLGRVGLTARNVRAATTST